MIEELDRKILLELDKNVRASNSKIAKAIGVSKDVVNYRINKLQKEGILTGFFSLTSVTRLGIFYHKLLLKAQSLDITTEEEMLNWLSDHPNVVWLGSCDGNWNLIITTATRDLSELERLIEQISTKYGKFFSKKLLLQVLSVRMFNEKYIYPKGEFVYEQHFSLLEKPQKIDAKDNIIISEISKDSRCKISEIADKINLTPEATAKRLRFLLKGGTIVGLRVRINFAKLGYDYFHVFVSTKDTNIRREIVEYYKRHPDCVAILEHLGYYDMHLEFVVKSTQHFRQILKDLRNRFGEKITEYEPLQIYTEYKINPYPHHTIMQS